MTTFKLPSERDTSSTAGMLLLIEFDREHVDNSLKKNIAYDEKHSSTEDLTKTVMKAHFTL